MDYPVLVNPGKPLEGCDDEENQGDCRGQAPQKPLGAAQACAAARRRNKKDRLAADTDRAL
jgi:hypothetical protein